MGGALGLLHSTLKKMSDNKLPDDMVEAWLRGDDNVPEDSQTWDGLIVALEKQRHGGVAKKVRGNKLLVLCPAWTITYFLLLSCSTSRRGRQLNSGVF